MSGSNGKDSTLEYILSDACGFLCLHPYVPGAKGHRFLWPRAGDAYLFVGALGMFHRGPESLPRVDERGRRVR
jgi:hypothetical protein